MPTIAALEARIRALESDNRALSAAAPAFPPPPGSPPSAAELSAAARHDRHLAHALSQLDISRAEAARLRDHLRLADDMARTLRATTVHLSLRAPRAPPALPRALLRALARYTPPQSAARADAAALAAVPVIAALLPLLAALRAHVRRNAAAMAPHARPVQTLLGRAAADAARAARWGFALDPMLPLRAAPLLDGFTALHGRVATLAAELADPPAVAQWTPGFAAMKLDLVRMELDRLQASVGEEGRHDWDAGREEGDVDAELLMAEVMHAVEERARVMEERAQGKGGGVMKQQQEQIVSLKTRLDAAKGTVKRRDAEIEEMKIRASLFEEQMAGRRQEMKQLELARHTIGQLEDQLDCERENVVVPAVGPRDIADAQLQSHRSILDASTGNVEKPAVRAVELHHDQSPIVEKKERQGDALDRDDSRTPSLKATGAAHRHTVDASDADAIPIQSKSRESHALETSDGDTSVREATLARADRDEDQVPRYLERIDEAKESARLRHILVHRQLADLQSGQSMLASLQEKTSLDSNARQVRDSLRVALRNAREAASSAQAIRLDAQTLQPTTRGATMSRKQLLQAKALANRYLPDARHDRGQHIPAHAVQLQLDLRGEHQDAHIVTSALKQLMCL